MGLLGMMVTTVFFHFPLFKTILERVPSLPCPCSGSKEEEQFVFVLFLMKGKPSLARRNLNQIGH